MQHSRLLSISISVLKLLHPSHQAFAIRSKPTAKDLVGVCFTPPPPQRVHRETKPSPLWKESTSTCYVLDTSACSTTRSKIRALTMSKNIKSSNNYGSTSSSPISSKMKQEEACEEEFCEVIDDYGCHALESRIMLLSSTLSSLNTTYDNCLDTERWVRLQAMPDFEPMTPQQILQRIQEIQQHQETFGRADLYPREWVRTPSCTPEDLIHIQQQQQQQSNSPNEFSVLQFNILAQGLSFGPNTQSPFEPTQKLQEYKAKNSFGGFTSVEHVEVCLDFQLRQWRLLQAILEADCDILVLEEMDRFYGFFLPMLQSFGYQGYFVPKPYAPGVKLGWYSDGCAIFYRVSVFALDKEKGDNENNKEASVQRFSYQVGHQVGLITQLVHCPTGKKIRIVATHLKAQQKEECEVMRQQQVVQLLDILSKHPGPTIIAGDFNAEPSSQSVQRITKQDLFRSAYDLTDPNLVTTWKTRGSETKKRIIDYLFYTKDTIECSERWSIPHHEMMEQKLPSLRYPSDHILLAAKFRFRDS